MIAIMSGELSDLLGILPSRERSLSAGQFVFHSGDPVESLFWIREGLVHLQRFTKDGGAAMMQRASAGSLLAEASVFASHYNCAAVAAQPVNAVQFDVTDVRRMLREREGFAAAFAEHLAHEVMRMRSRAEIASLRTVGARLDAWLALQALDEPSGKSVELARELGVTPEALYRELGRRRKSRLRR